MKNALSSIQKTSSSKNEDRKTWRNDITGLRALAVLPVLLFHAFPNVLPGGFFGVDIFFVISGFLISSIIFKGLKTGQFSFSEFYTKRIRRIIPNLVLVLLFVIVLGYFFLFDQEYSALGRHVYSSAIFYQNFRLMNEIGGYFATASNQLPLLHLWSLSIEEQFYIAFPLLAWVVWKISQGSRKAVGILVGLITLGSFVLCITEDNVTRAFYYPLTRFWEIGIGIVLAFMEVFRLVDSKRLILGVRNLFSWLGLILISVALFGFSSDMRTPGWFSLTAVMGAAFLISAHEDAVINRTLLSCRVMTFIGLISYSLYLWHWPLLSYLHIALAREVQAWQILSALAVSFIIASGVYFAVELPLRRTKTIANKKIVFLLLGLLFMSFVLGESLKLFKGIPQREINTVFLESKQLEDWTYPRPLQEQELGGVPLQVLGSAQQAQTLFTGDSHIEQYVSRVAKVGQEANESLVFLSLGGCLIPNGFVIGKDLQEPCRRKTEELKRLLSKKTFKSIVIGQKWGSYLSWDKRAFSQALDQIQQWTREFPQTRFYVLLDYPWGDTDYDIRSYCNRLTKKPLKSPFLIDYPSDKRWKDGNDAVIKALEETTVLIKTDDFVCPNGQCNLGHFKDSNHLRSSYVETQAEWIDRVFDK